MTSGGYNSSNNDWITTVRKKVDAHSKEILSNIK